MIFEPRQIEQFLCGRKTLIIRPRIRRSLSKGKPITVRRPDGSAEEVPRGHFAQGDSHEVGAVITVQEVKEEERWRAPTLASESRLYRQETVRQLETRGHLKVTQRWEGFAHEVSDDQAQAAGHTDREAFFDWWREHHGARPVIETAFGEATVEIPVLFIATVLTELVRHPVGAGSVIDPLAPVTSEHEGYVHGGANALDSGPAVDSETQQRISSGDLATDAQEQFNRERLREAEARLARPPEEQLRDELEALREESPSDARRYEAQAARLAERIRAKRTRRAA